MRGKGLGGEEGEGQLQPGCKINYFLKKDFYLLNIGKEILATVKVGMDCQHNCKMILP